MPLSFDHLPSLGQPRQSKPTSNKTKANGLSFDSLPSINYAKSDDDIRFKIARGMSSQLFSSEEGNARILAEAKQKRTHPVRLLRAESKKIAGELPNDFNYKALDPLGILDGQQSLNRFSAAKENKPLKGFSYKDEAENIYNQFDDQNISTAVSKLKSVFPDAGFDKQRPSQVLADARQRFYPELDPTTFMRQMGANPRSKDNPAYVDAEPKEVSLASAMWNAVKTGATKPVAGAVRAYADYTGDEALAQEAQSVTEGTQEDMTDAMRGRSGAGKVAVGIANSAPLMALTYLTGGLASGVAGVGLGTAAMASGVGIDKYGSNRAEGFSVADSAKNAAVTGLAEGAFEAVPLGKFFKAAGPGLAGAAKKIGSQAVTEGTSEAMTSVAQDVADHTMLGKEMTADSLIRNAVDSAIVGGVMGAGFGSVAALRDSVRRKTETGDIAADSGAELAKQAVQKKLVESIDQQVAEAASRPNNPTPPKSPEVQKGIDGLLLRQAQADFDTTAKKELDLLRENSGDSSVGLGASQVASIANGIAEKWGIDAKSILGEVTPSVDAVAAKPSQTTATEQGFAGVASSLGTNPQRMLADSRVNTDVVAQPESEADSVSIGESAIHGNGLIANRSLDSNSGVTLAIGANRTEAGQVVNHSDTPNTNVAIVDGVSTAVPVAPIERGEELTINYQKDIPRIRDAAAVQTQNQVAKQQDQRINLGSGVNDVAELSAQISNIRNAAKNRMLKTSEKQKIAELTGAINAINQEVSNDAGQYGSRNGEPSNSIEVEKDAVPRMDQSLRQGDSLEVGQRTAQQFGVEQGSQGQTFAVPPVANTAAVDDPVGFLQSENEKLKAEAEKYRVEARSNDITRLPNRRQFDDDFATRPSRAVAAIDMDGLKALNDSVGHKAADAILARLGEHLRGVESRGGRAYHLSGDEFAVSFDDPDSAQQIMTELQDQLDNVEVTIDTPSGQYVYRGIGVSFGVGENYAKADESAKSDKQRRLESGKREDARAVGGQRLPTPRRLVQVAPWGDINNVQGRDLQRAGDSQAGQVEVQQSAAVPQQEQAQITKPRMTRDQVRSDIARNLGNKVATKLEKQPWFNIVDSVDDLPDSILKSIDDAQNTQGFVTPDGNVYIVAGNIDSNTTGVVLHEVGVHYGMRGVLGKDFAPTIERFKSLRNSNKKVQAAYDSVPKDTAISNIDEEALAYYVEDNWATKAPLMQRITDAIKAFANRLGIPLSKLNASPELLVQIAKGATKKAASGRVRVNGGDTMRSTVKTKGLPPTINIDGVERSTTNSNGKPIADTEEGVRNFWNWFGDSKVVDADGRPMVVYHGSDEHFVAFDKTKIGSNFGLDKVGFFFSDDADTADRSRKSYPKKPKYSFTEEDRVAAKTGRIIEAYIKIERPLYSKEVPGWENSMGTSAVNLYDLNRDAIETILRSGKYDGYMLKAEGRRLVVPLEPTQIKSATGNSGEFSPENPDIRYSKRRSKVDDGGAFYSALTRGIESLPMNAATSPGWKSTIVGLTNKGIVKADEVEWSGVNEWLDLQQGKVAKQQLLDYLNANGVKLDEVSLSSDKAKYSQYSLPGGDNYREVLLTLPDSKRVALQTEKMTIKKEPGWEDNDEKYLRVKEIEKTLDNSPQPYKSTHWDQPNVLAHIRLNDRIDVDGKRVLFVEEIQSDWGQDGKKKGFYFSPEKKKRYEELRDKWLANDITDTEGDEFDALDPKRNSGSIPAAPFVTATDKWLALALKRVVKMAIDGGYDRVAFINGEQSAGRYDLSKSVDRIEWDEAVVAKGVTRVRVELTERGAQTMFVDNDTGNIIRSSGPFGEISGKPLEDVIGKELSKSILSQPFGELKGDGLKVGGEGMKAFYDKIVPSVAKDVLRKIGGGNLSGIALEDSTPVATLSRTTGRYFVTQEGPTFETRDEANAWAREQVAKQPGFDITQAMREKAADGLPLFSKRRTPKEALVESKNKKDYVQKSMPTNIPAEWDWSDATKTRGQGYRARITKLREQVQDRMLVFRDARDDIEAQKEALSEASDVYTLENLASGKAGDRIAILEKRYAEPLIKKMKDTGVSPEFLEDYLEAKHAIERNDGVAKINPDMPDFGSGMGTKEAQDFLDGKTNGMRSDRTINAKDMANLESLAKSVYSVTANTRKALLDSGIIDKAKFDAMEASYKYYVPLRGKDGIEPGFERIGTGIRRVKDPIKRALGRGEDNRAQNILGEVFADAQRAIILSEKANVDQGLLRMALEYPNASAYEVEPVKVEQAFSEAAGEVYSAVQSVDNEPGVVIVPYKGRRYRVLLKDERMANAYNKLNAEQLNSVFNFMGSLNRWFSAVLTRYNPSFVAVNMTRDFILGSSSIAAEHGVKTAAKVVKAYFPAMRAIWRDVRGKDAEVGLSKMAREYAEDGGKTSFAISERVEDIQKRIGTEFQTGVNLIASGKPVAAMRKWIGDSSIVAAIEDANDAVENAMRFAAYSVLRQEGMSRQKAAQYAKDLTVNFNRRGQVTTILNSLYLFFNAGVQGGHRTLKLMKDNPGKMSVVLGGIASLQGVLAFMAMGIKDDETGKSLWDSVPDWEKLRNIVIPYFAVSNGNKTVRTVKIPMPYGFNLFSYAGGRAAKLAHDMSNGVDINGGEFVSDMTAGVAGAFSPLPLESQGWSSILPYWANIGLALRTNKDDLGRPITQEQAYAKYEKPRISYGKVDSPQVFKSLAKGLNRLGGGDDFIKPMAPAILDWSPEDLQYIAEKLTGGLGSTVVKSTSLAESLIGGIDVTAKEVPIVSSFFSSVDKATINATTYYDAREKIERDLDRIRASAMGKSGVTPDTEILDMADVRVKKSKSDAVTVTGGTLLKSYRRTEKELRNIRGEMMAVYGDDSISFIQKKLRIKQLQMKRSETQQRFNRQLSELDRK